jgi:P-type Cu+ transporter
MWTGNSSRIQWSLFFLATPVMFYSAGSFHRRGLKDIYVLWRRGSRTPVWRRFTQFGSMDLLVRVFTATPATPSPIQVSPLWQVSSGVSVAYFSSIVLLALAASSLPSPDGHADTSTYFDSVVFLTMFLLTGTPLARRNEEHV